MDERATWEAQSARNLQGMELEQQGRLEEAVALYEQTIPAGSPPKASHQLALALSRLAAAHRDLAELDEAVPAQKRILISALFASTFQKRISPIFAGASMRRVCPTGSP